MDIKNLKRTAGGGVLSPSGKTRINPSSKGQIWIELFDNSGTLVEVQLDRFWGWPDLFDPQLPTHFGHTARVEGKVRRITICFCAGEFREFPG